jgi:dipeptidyl aminopeptidase/acylaminoacyl peptidase
MGRIPHGWSLDCLSRLASNWHLHEAGGIWAQTHLMEMSFTLKSMVPDRLQLMRTSLCLLLAATSVVARAQFSPSEQLYFRTFAAPYQITGGYIEPHWMEDGNRFWYVEGSSGAAHAMIVDPVANTKSEMLDPDRVNAALSKALGYQPKATGLPFSTFTLEPGEQSIRFSFASKDFILHLPGYAIESARPAQPTPVPRFIRHGIMALVPDVYEKASPDGDWLLGSAGGNLYVRPALGGKERPLTQAGVRDNGWDAEDAQWSPDSRTIIAAKSDERQVPEYPIVDWLEPLDRVVSVRLPRIGYPKASIQTELIDLSTGRTKPIQDSSDLRWIGWSPSGDPVAVRSGLKRVGFVVVDQNTGKTRDLFSETTPTFFDLALSLPNSPNYTPVGRDRFLWLSERDGWNQIYLYSFAGKMIRQLTSAQKPVSRVLEVDLNHGWIYYTAYGGPGRPYDIQLYRVSLEGGESTRLTDAQGVHDGSIYLAFIGDNRSEGIRFSPSKRFFLDTFSDVNRAPETDLRTADGKLLAVISKADGTPFESLRSPPREFTAKAADGTTDLYGVMYLPHGFDPARKYPVIDAIYAGPQTTWVSHNYIGVSTAFDQAVANLGFVVVSVDARGTPNRGKAFQDVVYMNFGRNEIPDHVAVIKQLANENSYIDESRVGVFGGSFGGYFTLRAMLQAPDFFKVGVALSAATDLRLLSPGLESYLGDPVANKAAYDYASNLLLAKCLKGRLLIVHGTSDVNAPFSGCIQMIDALEKAGKAFDLILLPEQNHIPQGEAQSYYLLALKRYFEHNLVTNGEH